MSKLDSPRVLSRAICFWNNLPWPSAGVTPWCCSQPPYASLLRDLYCVRSRSQRRSAQQLGSGLDGFGWVRGVWISSGEIGGLPPFEPVRRETRGHYSAIGADLLARSSAWFPEIFVTKRSTTKTARPEVEGLSLSGFPKADDLQKRRAAWRTIANLRAVPRGTSRTLSLLRISHVQSKSTGSRVVERSSSHCPTESQIPCRVIPPAPKCLPNSNGWICSSGTLPGAFRQQLGTNQWIRPDLLFGIVCRVCNSRIRVLLSAAVSSRAHANPNTQPTNSTPSHWGK